MTNSVYNPAHDDTQSLRPDRSAGRSAGRLASTWGLIAFIVAAVTLFAGAVATGSDLGTGGQSTKAYRLLGVDLVTVSRDAAADGSAYSMSLTTGGKILLVAGPVLVAAVIYAVRKIRSAAH